MSLVLLYGREDHPRDGTVWHAILVKKSKLLAIAENMERGGLKSSAESNEWFVIRVEGGYYVEDMPEVGTIVKEDATRFWRRVDAEKEAFRLQRDTKVKIVSIDTVTIPAVKKFESGGLATPLHWVVEVMRDGDRCFVKRSKKGKKAIFALEVEDAEEFPTEAEAREVALDFNGKATPVYMRVTFPKWVVKVADTYLRRAGEKNRDVVFVKEQIDAFRFLTREEALREGKPYEGRAVKLRSTRRKEKDLPPSRAGSGEESPTEGSKKVAWVVRFSSGLYMKQGGHAEPDTSVEELSEATQFRGPKSARKIAAREHGEAMTTVEAARLDTEGSKKVERWGLKTPEGWLVENERGLFTHTKDVRKASLYPTMAEVKKAVYRACHSVEVGAVTYERIRVPATKRRWAVRYCGQWLIFGGWGVEAAVTPDLKRATKFSGEKAALEARDREGGSVVEVTGMPGASMGSAPAPKTRRVELECPGGCRAFISFDVVEGDKMLKCPVCGHKFEVPPAKLGPGEGLRFGARVVHAWDEEESRRLGIGHISGIGEYRDDGRSIKVRWPKCEDAKTPSADDIFVFHKPEELQVVYYPDTGEIPVTAPARKITVLETSDGVPIAEVTESMPKLLVPKTVLKGLQAMIRFYEENERPKTTGVAAAQHWVKRLTETVLVKCDACEDEFALSELTKGLCKKCYRKSRTNSTAKGSRRRTTKKPGQR